MLGLFHLVISVYIFGITLGNLGINFSITLLASKELSIKNYNELKKISDFSIIFCLISGSIAGIILCLCSNHIIVYCLHKKDNT